MQYLRDEGLAHIWQSAGSILGLCSLIDAALSELSGDRLIRDAAFLSLACLWLLLGKRCRQQRDMPERLSF